MKRMRVGLLALPALLAAGVWWSQPSLPAPDPDPAAPEPVVEVREPPLPQPEIFVARDGLTVSVLTDTPVIRLGDSIRLMLRFRNEGPEPLLILLPRHPLPAPVSWRDYVSPPRENATTFHGGGPRPITDADLVDLAPGETWDMPIQSQVLAEPIRLAPGVHEIGVTYVNYPDYMSRWYDTYSAPSNIWEGMAVAEPVRITIEPPSPEAVARWMDALASDRPELLALELLALSGPEGVAALFKRIRTATDAGGIYLALRALAAADVLPPHDLIDALNAAGPHGRDRAEDVATVILPSRRQVDCALLEYGFISLQYLPGNYHDLFAPGVAACPSFAATLRAALLDPNQAETTRGHAATLLGLYRDGSDVPLLNDALEGRLTGTSARPSPYVSPIQTGSAAGLARLLDEPEAIAALTHVLGDSRQSAGLRVASARALSTMGVSAVTPLLIDLLPSPDQELVAAAISELTSLRATDAVPALMNLLRHRSPRLRRLAAGAIRTLDDPRAVEAMVAALDDADSYVRTYALFYLAAHGHETLRDRAMHALQHARELHVRQAAVEALARAGTEADAAQIRHLIEVVNDADVRSSLISALIRLTFVAAAHSGNLGEWDAWDAWYKQHRDATRVDWALDALRQAGEAAPFLTPQFHSSLRSAADALPYLASLDDPRAADAIERATDSRWGDIRITAARAIATFDRPRGMRLLIRELTGRSYRACEATHWTLNRLVDERRDLDCRSPAARAAAAAEWRAAVP